MILGRIKFVLDGEPHVAELDKELNWHCQGTWSFFVKVLLKSQIEKYTSPSEGTRGGTMLNEAKKLLHGELEWLVPKTPDVPGRVY